MLYAFTNAVPKELKRISNTDDKKRCLYSIWLLFSTSHLHHPLTGSLCVSATVSLSVFYARLFSTWNALFGYERDSDFFERAREKLRKNVKARWMCDWMRSLIGAWTLVALQTLLCYFLFFYAFCVFNVDLQVLRLYKCEWGIKIVG